MVWKRPRRPFAGGAGSRRRAPGFECHGSRPAFRGPRNMETDGIMRKEDGLIRHKENGAVRFRYPCRESNPAPSFRRLSKEIFKEPDGPARKGKGWPTGSDLIGSGLPPRSGFHGAREGVPAACPCRVSNPVPSFQRLSKEISRSRTAPPWVMGLGWRPEGAPVVAAGWIPSRRGFGRPSVLVVGLRGLAAAGDGHEGRASAEHDDRGQRD